MGRISLFFLHFRLLQELLRYDVIEAMQGFRGIHNRRRLGASRRRSSNPDLEAAACEALRRIVPFYWKRVACLQRSVATARVLRSYGTPAEVVIGYRLTPFLSHAWVEVGGRIVNDSPVFQRRLQVLERF